MSSQKSSETKSDKITDYSFYLMSFALGAGLLLTVVFVIYAMFF